MILSLCGSVAIYIYIYMKELSWGWAKKEENKNFFFLPYLYLLKYMTVIYKPLPKFLVCIPTFSPI